MGRRRDERGGDGRRKGVERDGEEEWGRGGGRVVPLPPSLAKAWPPRTIFLAPVLVNSRSSVVTHTANVPIDCE